MTKEEAREMVKIFQAYVDGKDVVFQFDNMDRPKKLSTFLSPVLKPKTYKVERKPRVIYVNKPNTGSHYCYHSKEFALAGIEDSDLFEYKAVKFVEETDE